MAKDQRNKHNYNILFGIRLGERFLLVFSYSTQYYNLILSEKNVLISRLLRLLQTADQRDIFFPINFDHQQSSKSKGQIQAISGHYQASFWLSTFASLSG